MWRMFSKSVRPVILLTNDTPLGIPGEVVSVKPGYARNFLIPKGHAVWHTWENKEKFANLVDEEEMAKIKAERAVEDFKKQLGKLTLSFHREVFSLNKEAVKDVISKDYVVTMLQEQLGDENPLNSIELVDEISKVGKYQIPANAYFEDLQKDLDFIFKVVVVPKPEKKRK